MPVSPVDGTGSDIFQALYAHSQRTKEQNELSAADDFVEAMQQLDSYVATELMKVVANLSAINPTKRDPPRGSS